MRVLHFSDIHIGVSLSDMPLGQWFGKRGIGGANLLRGRGKRFAAAEEKLATLAGFEADNAIDLVICTGDYTALGLEPEFAKARKAVEPLMQAPAGYVNVPGNHDLYVPEVVRGRRFERHFSDTLGSDLPELAVDGPWPLVRLIGEDVAVVAVNSARPNPQPWRSSGKIPARQLSGLRAALDDARIRDRFVFIATHYAPRLANGSHDTRLHGLVNADEFLAVCAGVARGAILCGHNHHLYRVRIADVGPEIFCAGSATLEGRETFWCFDIEGQTLTATAGRWDPDAGGYSLRAAEAERARGGPQ